jgi:hypothetical protein
MYAMREESWLSRRLLGFACRHESPGDGRFKSVEEIVELLDQCNIRPDIQTTKGFQSEVGIGLFLLQESGS